MLTISRIYFDLLIMSGFTTAVLTFISWRLRNTRATVPFFLLLLSLTEWTFGAAGEVAATSVQAKILWSKIEYPGVAFAPLLFLIFVLVYSQLDQWLTRRNLVALSILPLITIGMAVSNDLHHWLWTSFSLNAATNIMIYGHGPWFWINAAYSYLLVLAGTLVLIWDVIRFPLLYRRQALAMITAAAIPWVSNAVYIFRISPAIGLDWTSVALSITGIIFFFIIFRLQFLNLLPVTRGRVFNDLNDGVIVIDPMGRIADVNPSALNFLGLTSNTIIGQAAQTIFSPWPELAAAIQDQTGTKHEVELSGDPTRFVDLQSSFLNEGNKRQSGKLILFRDITEQVEAGRRLVESLDLTQKIFSTSSMGITVYKASGQCIMANQAAGRIIQASVDEILKQNFRHLVTWEKSGLLQMALSALETEIPQQGEVHHYSTFGRESWINSSFTAFYSYGEPHLLFLFEDVTERKHFEQVEHEQRILAEALRDTAEALNSSFDLNVILDRVLANIRQVIAYDAAEIYIFDSQGNVQVTRLNSVSTLVTDEITRNIETASPTFKTLRMLRETGQPVVIQQVRNDPDWVIVPGLEWVRSHVSAPISVKGKVIGAVGLNSQQPDSFSKNDVHQLLAFASAAAIAIDNARLYTEVQRLAITDELTGLYNYRALMEMGPREIERARRFKRSVSALFMDIDNFRDFNNRYSHAVGNLVLSAVAQRITACVREMDLVVRFGGEEFVIILPETSLAFAKMIAERLIHEVANTCIKTEWGDLTITISAGAADLQAGIPDLKALIDCANQAEHLAKQLGRNRVEIFTPQVDGSI